MSHGKFERKSNLSNGFVNNINDGLQAGSIQKIKLAFPNLNTEWLTTGEGEMLKRPAGNYELNDTGGDACRCGYLPGAVECAATEA